MTSKRWLRTMFLAAAATAAFALSGCGDDKPTNPGGNNTGDDFDETTAAAQASVAAPQAAALAQSITSIADGMGAKDGTYDWNARTMRWEYHLRLQRRRLTDWTSGSVPRRRGDAAAIRGRGHDRGHDAHDMDFLSDRSPATTSRTTTSTITTSPSPASAPRCTR
ncbi:MAG: hypothetical protein IPI34_12045 [bacterium]|nr:hypothetical protein [bacterium]